MHSLLRQYFAAFLVAIFIVLIALYAYYQSRAIIEGPGIVIEAPSNGMTSTTSLVAVLGVTTHAKEITLDGRPIFINLEGYFSEKLVLMEGYNIIELVAKDNEGRVVRKTIELVYQAQ